MKEYLLKYPKEEKNVYAMLYAWGDAETNLILNRALKEDKKVKLLTDNEKLDWLNYEFVSFKKKNNSKR
jgi:hypothetical protein